MRGLRRSGVLMVVALCGCSSKIDGPTPTVTTIVGATGSNVICTCDAIGGCVKQSPDVLKIGGSGFAPLPVALLGETPRLELPSVLLKGPRTFTIYGDDASKNPTGVGLRWKSSAEMELTLTPDYVKEMPPGSYTVAVVNPSGAQGELASGLLVVLGPRVVKVAPDTICPTIDQPLKVSGESFRSGARVALIGGGTTTEIPGAVFNEQTRDLEVVVKAGTIPVGDYDVQVILAEGCSHTLPAALHMVAPPTLTSITPQVICDQIDATKLTLSGKDFRAGASVSVGGKALAAADVTFVSGTTIEIIVRKGLVVGQYDVTVTNPEGCASTLPKALTVVPPPTLASVAPATVCSGGVVTLTGTGFLAGAAVTVGTAVLSGSAVTVSSATTITVDVGPLAPGGPYDVKVTNADGCGSAVLKGALTVTPGPVVVAVDPSTVYNKVNFPVAIFGSGFKAGLTVALSTTPPTALTGIVVAPTGDRIDAVVPAGVPPGTYDLTVKDPGGCSYTFKVAVKVIDQLTVAVCGIDPPFGYTNVKTAVTITSGSGPGCSTGTQPFASTPRGWLDVAGVLKPIRSLAFVTATSLTGSVEAGLTVGGPYDLVVQNPDGQIGLLAKAFRVVNQPVPQIDALNPSSVTTQYTGALTITGQSFRSPVTVEAISSTGAKTTLTAPTVSGGTQIAAGLNVAGLALAVGAYVIRVTNTDQSTYSDFSALAITNPAGNLGAWSTASAMVTARRRHALVAGRVSSAARFLYAVGGDGGTTAPAALDTVELVPLDKFGGTGAWVVQRYKLKAPRTALGALVQGRFLYVLGGDSGSGPVQAVERAIILDPSEAPEVTSFSFTLGGTLAKGAWYYRVAAVMPASHATNPAGETLCSDPVIVQAIQGVKVSLTWKPVAGAVSYNIYRTPAAGGVSGGEQLLVDGVLPAVACATTCSYEDSGGTIKNPNQTPLPIGATGVFVQTAISQLSVARSGAAVGLGHDPGGARFVYLAGGRSSATTVLDTVEVASLTADGSTLGGFAVSAAKMDAARERLLLVAAESATSPKLPAGTSYLYAAGGTNAGGAVKDGASSLLASGGALGAFGVVVALKQMPIAAVGSFVNDTFYYFGGSSDGTTALAGSKSCVLNTPPALDNCNSLGGGALPSARMNAALALESAFFYIAGGGATDGAAGSDVLKTIY